MKQIEKIWMLATWDIATAPGTTEPYYLVQKFAERWETHIFAPLSGPVESAYEHRLPVESLAAAFLFNTILAPYFIWQAIRNPPDLVYSYRNIFVPVLVAKLLTEATVVYDIRADPYEQAKEFEQYESRSLIYHLFLLFNWKLHQFSLPRVDGVITLSEPLADQIHKEYHVPRERIGIIPLAADPDEFSPAKSSGDRLRIVYFGSITEFRGIDDVVLALTALEPELRSRIQLDLYGSADEEFIQSLRDLAPNGPPIEWHGYIEHDQIAEEVAKCDIAVSPLPPLESYEVSSPAKIYEYLALGLPIIATDITPHRRILTEECSILIPPSDGESMTIAFTELIENQDMRIKLSKNSRELALENTWMNRFTTLCEYLNRWSNT